MKKIALILGLCGALMLALNLGLTLPAYCVMFISSALFIWQLWGKEQEIVTLNLGYACLNVIGIATSFN
jgi:hypothetical protein